MKKTEDTLGLIKEVLPQDLLGRGGTMHHLCLSCNTKGSVINSDIRKSLPVRSQYVFSKTVCKAPPAYP